MLQGKSDDKLPLEYFHLIILARLCRNFHITVTYVFLFVWEDIKQIFMMINLLALSHISQFMNRIGRKEFDSALEKIISSTS